MLSYWRCEDAHVAVALVQHPRHHDRGVTPHGGRPGLAEHVGHDERDDAVGIVLLDGEVGEPRREEAVDVEQEARRRGEHLDVAGPAQAFVTLRAVGGQVEEVAPHAPHDVLVQAVDRGRRSIRTSRCARMSEWHDDRPDVLGVELARPAVDLDIAEAVEGEARLPRLVVTAAQRVAVRGRRVAQRAGAELAVLEDFGVTQRDRRAGRSPRTRDAQPADEVLAEVDDRPAARRCRDRNRRDFLDAANRRTVPADEHAVFAFVAVRAAPFAVVELGLGPTVAVRGAAS